MASPSAFPQRPRVFLTCAWECAPVVRVLAVRVRCERVAAARPRAWTRRTSTHTSTLPQTRIHKLYERVVASYFEERAS